jgi:hypothetical protein
MVSTKAYDYVSGLSSSEQFSLALVFPVKYGGSENIQILVTATLFILFIKPVLNKKGAW